MWRIAMLLSLSKHIHNGELIATVLLNGIFCLQGKHLRCSNANEVKSVFLPLGDTNNNYSLSVVVTVKNEYKKATTTVSTQVCHLWLIINVRERRCDFTDSLQKHTDTVP